MDRTSLKVVLARWVLLAELDLCLAIRTWDGSPAARRRYREALEQLRLARWEARTIGAGSWQAPPT